MRCRRQRALRIILRGDLAKLAKKAAEGIKGEGARWYRIESVITGILKS